MKQCSMVDCDKPQLARGYCTKHYTRWRKHGDPNFVTKKRKSTIPPIDRFKAKYLVDADSGCWLWTGAANSQGWAVFSVDGKTVMAHRFAYEAYRGPLPEGTIVSRSCGQSLCVNPGHLIQSMTGSVVDRFWSKVERTNDGHWLWKPKGFIFRALGASLSPRQYAWVHLAENEPKGVLYALCGHQRCIRPEHAGTSVDRFWSKVDKAADGCWYWTASTLPNGYPHVTHNGVSVYAHRLSYEWAGGHLEEGFVLTHTCKHKTCVNPQHLEQTTFGDAVRKQRAKS